MKPSRPRGLLVAASSLLLLLTGCSADSTSPASAGTDEAAETEKFQTLWREAGDMLPLPKDGEYLSAADANRFQDLSEASALHYVAYFFPTPDQGHWCAVSDDDTFIASLTEDGKETLLLGTGPCSVDPADAVVVGDPRAERWTKGADLMGGEEMQPWGSHQPYVAPASGQVVDAANAASVAVMEHFASHGQIPQQVADIKVALPEGIRIEDYTVDGDPAEARFTLCATSAEKGEWALYSSEEGLVVESGTKAKNTADACEEASA